MKKQLILILIVTLLLPSCNHDMFYDDLSDYKGAIVLSIHSQYSSNCEYAIRCKDGSYKNLKLQRIYENAFKVNDTIK